LVQKDNQAHENNSYVKNRTYSSSSRVIICASGC
jgi:hypothetical protein